MPVQRPIPIWFGGGSEQVLKRIGQTGDGWITTTRNIGLDDSFRDKIDRIHQYAREAGRDPKDIGIEGPIVAGQGSPEDWADSVAQWKSFGAPHVSFSTMKSGFDSPQQHIDAIRRFKEAIP